MSAILPSFVLLDQLVVDEKDGAELAPNSAPAGRGGGRGRGSVRRPEAATARGRTLRPNSSVVGMDMKMERIRSEDRVRSERQTGRGRDELRDVDFRKVFGLLARKSFLFSLYTLQVQTRYAVIKNSTSSIQPGKALACFRRTDFPSQARIDLHVFASRGLIARQFGKIRSLTQNPTKATSAVLC